jgi:hypothetical protein
MTITTLSDCTEALLTAIIQTPVGEDVKLNPNVVHEMLAALKAANEEHG